MNGYTVSTFLLAFRELQKGRKLIGADNTLKDFFLWYHSNFKGNEYRLKYNEISIWKYQKREV